MVQPYMMELLRFGKLILSNVLWEFNLHNGYLVQDIAFILLSVNLFGEINWKYSCTMPSWPLFFFFLQ